MIKIPYAKWELIKHTPEFWAKYDDNISHEDRELGVIHYSEYADINNPDPNNLNYYTTLPKFLLENYKDIAFHDDTLSDALAEFRETKDESLSSNFIFEWDLREEQKPLIQDVLNKYQTNGYVNGLIVANPGFGKGLVETDSLPTPDGWLKVANVKVGDNLIDKHGNITKVLGIFPQGPKDIYKVNFCNGTFVMCDDEHLWEVSNEANVYSVENTKQLVELLKNDTYNVDLCGEVKLNNNKPFHMSPVIKGCFISSRFGYDVPSEKINIDNNLLQHYHTIKINDRIPEKFLFDTIENRKELLDSIMFNNEFKCISRGIADDILHLIQSLGIYHEVCKKTIHFDQSTEEMIEFYHIKINNTKCKKQIVSIELQLMKRNTICFSVDNEEQLFLCKDFTVTHNTASSIKIASLLKKQTLIVVPNDLLEKQWADSIVKSTNLTYDDIGIIQGSDIAKLNKKNTYLKEIAIVKVQSLLSQLKTFNIDSLESLYSRYGVVFYDECHTSGSAESYAKTSFLFKTKNIIGLTATPYVKGINKFLLNNGIGPVIHHSDHQNLIADVHMHNVHIEFTEFELNRLRMIMNDYILFMATLNNILESKQSYFDYLCQWAKYYHSQGRSIVILFSNNKLISKMADTLKAHGLKDEYGILIGKTDGEVKKFPKYMIEEDYTKFQKYYLTIYPKKKKTIILKEFTYKEDECAIFKKYKLTKKQLNELELVNAYLRDNSIEEIVLKEVGYIQNDRDINAEFPIILSNFKLLSAGADYPKLSVAIFGSLVIGKINVNQTIGRITRLFKGKPTPKAHFMFPSVYIQYFKTNHFVLTNNIKVQYPTTHFTYENFPREEKKTYSMPIMPAMATMEPYNPMTAINQNLRT